MVGEQQDGAAARLAIDALLFDKDGTLIHDVLLASASIPGVFPPVMIDVEADGRRFDEMHVDGGVTAQVFVYPTGLDWGLVRQRLGVQGKPSLYVINNSRPAPAWETGASKPIAPRRNFPS